jgi:Domain of unknown function (DUF4111)
MEDTNIPGVPAVVEALASELAGCLRGRLVGVYLGGSITMRDFVPATSDYDVLVVIDGVLSPEDLSVLDALHRRLLAEYPDAPRLEGEYAPRHLLVPEGTTAPVPGFYGGQFKPDIVEIMLSADNLANMRESGVAVYGPTADTVLPPVTPDDVRAAALNMLREGPGECATEQAAAAEVLNLVRCLCVLETGRPATKSEAAAWALGHLDEHWHAVVQRAEAVRRGEPVAQGDTRLGTALPAMNDALRPLHPDAGDARGVELAPRAGRPASSGLPRRADEHARRRGEEPGA